MTARLILKHPDSRLRIQSEEVTEEDWSFGIEKWCTDIRDTMKANAGLGLAAPQVGIHKRIFALDVKDLDAPQLFQQEPQDATLFFINPQISHVIKDDAKSIEAPYWRVTATRTSGTLTTLKVYVSEQSRS